MIISPDFSPCSALLGGVIIGGAASLLLATTGQIAGFSGIVRRATSAFKGAEWQWAFTAGVWVMGSLTARHYPAVIGSMTTNAVATSLAGLLVGYGTRLANGCTSGHGVCGIPRLSIRSIVAVLTFMTTGLMTRTLLAKSTVLHQLVHEGPGLDSLLPWISVSPLVYTVVGTGLLLATLYRAMTNDCKDKPSVMMMSFIGGSLFAAGLCVSGMTKPTKVQNFLDMCTSWDPSLALVMGSAVSLNFVTFHYILSQEKPLCGDRFCVPTATKVTARLVTGAAIFGLGWAIGGICPGPALIGMSSGAPSYLVFVLAMVMGMHMASEPVESCPPLAAQASAETEKVK